MPSAKRWKIPTARRFYGIRKVLFEGTERYRGESKNAETLEKYGHGMPDDLIERKLNGDMKCQ